MKKFFIGMPFLLIIGCTHTPELPDLPAPTNLRITSIDNGLGLKLEWDPVKDADGYYIYFIKWKDSGRADTFCLCKVLAPYFCDEYYKPDVSPALSERGCGDYLVVPVRRIYDKDTVGVAASISSLSIEVGSGIIYEKNKVDSGAYGWNENGVGSVYSINESVNEWDVYLTDGDSSRIINSLFHFCSPPWSMSIQQDGPAPGLKWDTTLVTGPVRAPYEEIAPNKNTYDKYGKYAPGYSEGIKEKGEIYYLFIDHNYYVRVVIDSVLPDGVMINSRFQSIKGFRWFL